MSIHDLQLLAYLSSLTSSYLAKPETKTTLPKVLAKSMLPHFLAPVIPRLSLIVFRYSQPALITIAIRYLSNSSGELLTSGFSVVSMAVIVYLGLTASISWHC